MSTGGQNRKKWKYSSSFRASPKYEYDEEVIKAPCNTKKESFTQTENILFNKQQKKKDKIRYVISLAWKKPNATVLNWNMGFTQKMYYGWLEKFICSLNAYQLHSIGFPHPLDSYWCRETIHNTKERFKSYEFDLDKYLESDII